MTEQEKKTLVSRIVGSKLRGWKAGQECARTHLTLSQFEAVTSLSKPTFKTLRKLLRTRGQSEFDVDDFWDEFTFDCDQSLDEITASPDFARAFVQSVRAVWEEVREEVLSAVAECPGRHVAQPKSHRARAVCLQLHTPQAPVHRRTPRRSRRRM